MKKALLSSAGALALSLGVTGGALAADNNAKAQGDQIAVQDVLNGSLNDNGNDNTIDSFNGNTDLDLALSLDNAFNDDSENGNQYLALQESLHDVANDKSTTEVDASANWSDDNSVNLSNIAVVVSEQYLDGLAAAVDMQAERGNVNTGDVVYGAQTNKLAAGNITDSLNTGAGSVALAASGIQANGTFRIGN